MAERKWRGWVSCEEEKKKKREDGEKGRETHLEEDEGSS
jgi:hypothetical protein